MNNTDLIRTQDEPILRSTRLNLYLKYTQIGFSETNVRQRLSEKGLQWRQELLFCASPAAEFVALVILGNPIFRGNPIRSRVGLCTNVRTTFRCMGFSETQFPANDVLGNSEGVKRAGAA